MMAGFGRFSDISLVFLRQNARLLTPEMRASSTALFQLYGENQLTAAKFVLVGPAMSPMSLAVGSEVLSPSPDAAPLSQRGVHGGV